MLQAVHVAALFLGKSRHGDDPAGNALAEGQQFLGLEAGGFSVLQPSSEASILQRHQACGPGSAGPVESLGPGEKRMNASAAASKSPVASSSQVHPNPVVPLHSLPRSKGLPLVIPGPLASKGGTRGLLSVGWRTSAPFSSERLDGRAPSAPGRNGPLGARPKRPGQRSQGCQAHGGLEGGGGRW